MQASSSQAIADVGDPGEPTGPRAPHTSFVRSFLAPMALMLVCPPLILVLWSDVVALMMTLLDVN